MPVKCAVPRCGKDAYIRWDGSSKFALLCSHHIQQLWGPEIDTERGGVENPHHDANSSDELCLLTTLPLIAGGKRLKNVEPTLMFRPETPLAMIQQAAPLIRAALNKRKTRNGATNNARAADADDAIVAAGDMVDLTKDELEAGCQAIYEICYEICDSNDDLVSIVKASVVPNPGGRDKVKANETERKYRYSDAAILLTADGTVPDVGAKSKKIRTLEVDSLVELARAAKSHRENAAAEVLVISLQVCRATTTKSALQLEEMGQKMLVGSKCPNHTEDEMHHSGNVSSDPAVVAVTVAVGALASVREGPFYLNSSLPLFFQRRMRRNYDWAGGDELWRAEATGARLRKIEYNRGANAKRAENKKAKTGA